MFFILDRVFEIFVFLSSIFLIYAGLAKKEKYSANNFLKKSLIIIGLCILVLSFLAGIPDLINGYKAGAGF
jgi:hypothetical protein